MERNGGAARGTIGIRGAASAFAARRWRRSRRHVRDVAIQSCDLQLLPHSETPMAKRWRKAAIPFNGKVPPEVLIPDCVDETIFTFLRAIDKGLLPLSFTAENGETVDLTKDGNLAGRYIEPGGWRDQFSKERIGKD